MRACAREKLVVVVVCERERKRGCECICARDQVTAGRVCQASARVKLRARER